MYIQQNDIHQNHTQHVVIQHIFSKNEIRMIFRKMTFSRMTQWYSENDFIRDIRLNRVYPVMGSVIVQSVILPGVILINVNQLNVMTPQK
jgi:hypothetical protein